MSGSPNPTQIVGGKRSRRNKSKRAGKKSGRKGTRRHRRSGR